MFLLSNSSQKLLSLLLFSFSVHSAHPPRISSNDRCIQEQGIIGVTEYGETTAYDFSNLDLPLPKDYDSWSDASFFGPNRTLSLIDSDDDKVNSLLYASQIAGTSSTEFDIDTDLDKREETETSKKSSKNEKYKNLADLVQSAYDRTGYYKIPSERFPRTIYQWDNRNWITSNRHKTRGTAVEALKGYIHGIQGSAFDFGRRSVCVNTAHGKACLSWSGITNTFEKNLAIDILDSARSTMGNAEMSLRSEHGVYGCKREIELNKRCGSASVCVSDRATGCH